ncbi:MAG: hypothetical protein ACW986_10350 [Promethearchaeota archaeon]|jgi:hypothetical protein
MEYNYYVYEKPECNIIVNKMPIWFKEIEYHGDAKNGSIQLQSENEYDEIWGSDSKVEIAWEKRERANLFYYKEVENSIEIYNSIGIVVTKKERDWLMGHEFTVWFGQRRKMMRKRFYIEKIIHAIFYCDITERLVNINTSIIESKFENFKPFVLKLYNTINCH